MKEKILLALKAKYKNLGFSDATFDTVAAYLAASVTEEDQIDNSLAGVETLLKSFQSDTERRIAAAKKEKEKKDEEQKTNPETKVEPSVDNAVLEMLKEMKAEITSLKAGKTTETRKGQLEAILKDAPESVKSKILKDFSRMNFADDAAFDEYKTETETDLSGLIQDFADKGLSGSPQPVFGQTSKTGVSTDTEAYIANQKAAKAAESGTTGKSVFATQK